MVAKALWGYSFDNKVISSGVVSDGDLKDKSAKVMTKDVAVYVV